MEFPFIPLMWFDIPAYKIMGAVMDFLTACYGYNPSETIQFAVIMLMTGVMVWVIKNYA